MKVRRGGRIVSVAATVAVAVNDQGRREVLGLSTGSSEAETSGSTFPARWRTAGCAACVW